MTPLEELARRSGGRTLDQSRDADLRVAVLDLLSEVGYDRLTVEGVAARAHAGKGAIYRRWPSKAEMVLDTLNALKPPGDLPLPDTGSLEGDLRALFDTALVGSERLFPLLAGLAAAFLSDPDSAVLFRERFICPRVDRFRSLLDRAVARGQLEDGPQLDLLPDLFPAFMIHRTIIGEAPPDPTFIRRVLEEIVIPLVTRYARPEPREEQS